MNESPIEYRLALARIKHLERMVARYKEAEQWENLQEGDRVMIDNSDSLHDGITGKFLAHEWSASGYVRLVVEFTDGKKCFYLPTQVVRVYEDVTPAPVATAPKPEPKPEPEPEPEKEPLKFKLMDNQELLDQNTGMIEAKLAQLAKIAAPARRGFLKSSFSGYSDLHEQAVKLAIDRGLIK